MSPPSGSAPDFDDAHADYWRHRCMAAEMMADLVAQALIDLVPIGYDNPAGRAVVEWGRWRASRDGGPLGDQKEAEDG